MRSEAITKKIMSEMCEEVKGFISETLANRRTVDFGEIEVRVSELSRHFGKRLTDGALEAIGNGYVGRTIECKCGGVMEYYSNSRWMLTSRSGKSEIYRAYYYCNQCKSSKVPLDEQLGFEGKHQSIGVRKCMALLGMVEGFQEASKRLKQLIKGKVESVIASLSELSSPNSNVTEEIESNITYFTNNKDRMRYNEYKAKGYHIGSGTVESACKHIVSQRLKQAGMTWSIQGADAIIQLRILWKNDEWHKFWDNRKLAA